MSDSSGIPAREVFDLLLIADATGSSHPFHTALSGCLLEIIRFATVTGAFSRIGVLVYRDYSERNLLEWSGWCDLTTITRKEEYSTTKCGGHPRDRRVSHDDLLIFASFKTREKKNHAEAVKTAMAMAHSVMRAEATTVTFLYADAPPHLPLFPTRNQKAEMAALTEDSYDGFGARFAEWTSACRTLARDGGKKAVVHCVVPCEPNLGPQTLVFLSTVTGGVYLEVAGISDDGISRATIGVLLAWMRVREGGGRPYVRRRYYANPESLEDLTSEELLLGPKPNRNPEKKEWRLLGEHVTTADFYNLVAPRATPVLDFAERYAADETYRALVIKQLRAIIGSDPATVTTNPVFTTFWRTLCSDLFNPVRDELVELFSQTAAQVRFGERRWLREWLEQSYDFSGEVEARIGGVSKEDMFPCVYLDRALDLTRDEADGEGAQDVSDFTREELLQIGRSCQPRLLSRLESVLSRLSYAESEEDLPQNIVAAGSGTVPRVPLALSKKEHHSRFFGSLLHAVLPGTVLMRRPAALLAALSLKMGIPHLRDAADAEMAAYRSFWNTTRAPETWDVDCLNLILDADDDYRRRIREGMTRPVHGPSLLLEEDRRIFGVLVGYERLQENMRSPLTARIGWTPANTRMGLGPVAVCRTCKYLRSVTVMAEDNVCGSCAALNPPDSCTRDPGELEVKTSFDVQKKDDVKTTGTWVECRVTACRAQYVIYNALSRGHPKCFYCRNSSQAPTVQCTKCLNRVIYPEEYRSNDLDLSTWECVACESGQEATVEVGTTLKQLVEENGRGWLIPHEVIGFVLRGRPLYHLARFCAYLSDLGSEVPILPESTRALTLSGKTVHNTEALKACLRDIICRRIQISITA